MRGLACAQPESSAASFCMASHWALAFAAAICAAFIGGATDCRV